MDLRQLIVDHYKQFFWGTIFLYSNFKLIKNLFQRSHYVKRYKDIENKPILSLQQVAKIAHNKQSSNSDKNITYLIKVEPQANTKLFVHMKQIQSNQFWLIEPSLNKISHQTINLFNQSFIKKNKTAIKRLQQTKLWIQQKIKIKSKSNLYGINLKEINGIGQILDHEIFKIKWNYQLNQNKGFFTRFLEGLAYYFQFFFFENTVINNPQNEPLSTSQNRRPFIKGPVIGNIFYIFQFIQNRKILIEARIQNGQIFAITNADSKQSILQSLNIKIRNSNIQIAYFLVISFLTYRAFRKVSKIISKMKRKLKANLQKFKNRKVINQNQNLDQFRLASSAIGETFSCIICYTNCRNTIFFNCRHMIMCDECKEVYKENNCPICKQEIQQHKILYKN